MYDQFRLNLKALDSISSRDSNGGIQTSEISKKTIPVVFWDIGGFSKLTKLFYSIDSENMILKFFEEYYIIAHNNGV